MSSHDAHISWASDGHFVSGKYGRRHEWRFDGGQRIRASSSPHVVPEPMSDPSGVDPEEALVAAVSSCHMLWFLALARKRGFAVATYEDDAEGVLDGKRFSAATLRPRVRWEGDPPTPEAIQELHRRAHELCFISNSVDFPVGVEPS